jgi:hypothetical protein
MKYLAMIAGWIVSGLIVCYLGHHRLVSGHDLVSLILGIGIGNLFFDILLLFAQDISDGFRGK